MVVSLLGECGVLRVAGREGIMNVQGDLALLP